MDNSRAFKNVEVDYLGPLFVLPMFKPGNQLFKVWVVLCTCASTRGIVLDVVDNMSSNAFLNSLRKFIARRGAPSLFVSDNGTSFKAIETQNFIATREITWKFNLEAAPWWGGFWERLVALVKACLKKTVGHKRLTCVELVTFLQEVECVLNNRPLCVPCDEEREVLTPNHLLYGRRLEVMNYSDNNDDVREDGSEATLTRRTKHLLVTMEHFGKRWKHEYLLWLSDHYKKGQSKANKIIDIDDVVIIADEKAPRHLWNLGRVIDLIKGKDNVLRGACVKVGKTGSIINRPINKLYPLKVRGDRVRPAGSDNEVKKIRRETAILGELRNKYTRFGCDLCTGSGVYLRFNHHSDCLFVYFII